MTLYPARISVRTNSNGMIEPRTYRTRLDRRRLTAFEVTVKETDLHVQARCDLSALTRDLILEQRGYLEAYIRQHPGFVSALTPWPLSGPAPNIVSDMIGAGIHAGVGPMAAVAGAVAEHVGRGLLAHTPEVIIENGGDIFLQTAEAVTIAVLAGTSPLSLRIGIRTGGRNDPIAVCTSSGTVGHSLSFGRADAVCAVSRSGALADAAATAIGNRIQSKQDIPAGIEFAKRTPGVLGVLIVAADKMGVWGAVEVVTLDRKKG
ncbi:MAG: UPF0280 family protein [Desulfobacterales bacterium]|nr:UPF0280 family protein [Desulfobacterales bacterium]